MGSELTFLGARPELQLVHLHLALNVLVSEAVGSAREVMPEKQGMILNGRLAPDERRQAGQELLRMQGA